MSVKNGIYGWAGSILRINLSTGAITTEDTLPKYKPYIGGIFSKFLDKGEKAGQKLVATASRKGLFIALLLFVGIPLPGTGAWTGTLAASLLNMGWKSTTGAVSLGVVLAGLIMAVVSSLGLHIFGL